MQRMKASYGVHLAIQRAFLVLRNADSGMTILEVLGMQICLNPARATPIEPETFIDALEYLASHLPGVYRHTVPPLRGSVACAAIREFSHNRLTTHDDICQLFDEAIRTSIADLTAAAKEK